MPLTQLESAQLEYRGEGWLLVDFAGKRTRFSTVPQSGARRATVAIVLDNADWYRRGAQLLQQHGYLELPFYGFKSGQSWISCTSLFIDPPRFAPRRRSPSFSRRFSREDEQILGRRL